MHSDYNFSPLVFPDDGVCHRTKVALYSKLLSPPDLRRYIDFQDFGEEKEGQFREQLDNILKRLKIEADNALRILELRVSEALEIEKHQLTVLVMRWKQIRAMLNEYFST
jgi:hypothetical protein